MEQAQQISPAPPRRSAGALQKGRVQQAWPKDREFRILSIDGGGIRGIFPAAVLAGLEEHLGGTHSIAAYFDLITGTSTGGILALGLAAGLPAASLRDLYVERGCEIFPQASRGFAGWARGRWDRRRRLFRYKYDREALRRVLEELLTTKTLGHSTSRLCIPSFDGRYGDVYIFKTPHHPDFRDDAKETMCKVALSTGAAPTYFQPLADGGYTFVDGGLYSNNPIMVGLVDALSCFDIQRERVSILSIGCGETRYVVDGDKITKGGMLHWRDIFNAASVLQSLNALGQASLLIGADRIVRVDFSGAAAEIELDDWQRAQSDLPALAKRWIDDEGATTARRFLYAPADPYAPVIPI